MQTIFNTNTPCPCGKSKHRVGARYCTKCGKKIIFYDHSDNNNLNSSDIDVLDETFAQIIAKTKVHLKPSEKIVGADLVSRPFFVTSSGFYWHYGFYPKFSVDKIKKKIKSLNKNSFDNEELFDIIDKLRSVKASEIDQSELLKLVNNLEDLKLKDFDIANNMKQLNLPGSDQGDILGIIANDEMAPWALICWNYLIILYNAFTTEVYTIWQKSKDANTKQACFRLPCLAVKGNLGEPDSSIRIFMIIEERITGKLPVVYSHVCDFILHVTDQKTNWKWRIKEISNFPRLSQKNLLMISSPFIGSKNTHPALFISNTTKKKTKQLLVLGFNINGEIYKKNMNYQRYRTQGMANKSFKLIPQGPYSQVQFQSSIFLWVQIIDEDNNSSFEVYELKEFQATPPTFNLIPWGTQEWHLGSTSPIAVIHNDSQEPFLAFLDDDDKITIISDTGTKIPFPFASVALNRSTPFVTHENIIWAVEKNSQHLKKIYVSDNTSHEVTVYVEASHLNDGNICSEIVLSNGSVFYLRKEWSNNNNNNNENNKNITIRMECV